MVWLMIYRGGKLFIGRPSEGGTYTWLYQALRWRWDLSVRSWRGRLFRDWFFGGDFWVPAVEGLLVGTLTVRAGRGNTFVVFLPTLGSYMVAPIKGADKGGATLFSRMKKLLTAAVLRNGIWRPPSFDSDVKATDGLKSKIDFAPGALGSK